MYQKYTHCNQYIKTVYDKQPSKDLGSWWVNANYYCLPDTVLALQPVIDFQLLVERVLLLE